jgi:hypothetical protein
MIEVPGNAARANRSVITMKETGIIRFTTITIGLFNGQNPGVKANSML